MNSDERGSQTSQKYAANSDRRTERRAAECSEQRATRLARRRVADTRARFAAISR